MKSRIFEVQEVENNEIVSNRWFVGISEDSVKNRLNYYDIGTDVIITEISEDDAKEIMIFSEDDGCVMSLLQVAKIYNFIPAQLIAEN